MKLEIGDIVICFNGNRGIVININKTLCRFELRNTPHFHTENHVMDIKIINGERVEPTEISI